MLRTLHIKHPCEARWDEMTGTDARRFCGRCEKHVVALSELTHDEAERLLSSAKPGSLCVRIEHNSDGAVHLRAEPANFPSPPLARSMLRVAVGASLLVAACRSDPQTPPEARLDVAAAAQPSGAVDAPTLASASPSAVEPAPPASPSARPSAEPAGAAPSRKAASAAASACDPQSGKALAKSKDRKITMGCVCAPGDIECSCL